MAAQQTPPVPGPLVDAQGNITRPWLFYLLSIGNQAQAAAAGVTQVGAVTPGHLATWVGDAQIEDGGAVPSGGSGITALTGDVTAGPGSGSQVATIAPDAVTLAQMQERNEQTLIGRNAGIGNPEEVTISEALDWLGT